MGALDFAGGNVVHISSGVAGLVLAIVLGKRKDGTAASPHNLIYTFLGGALIWFGWFGFNVGSALTLDSIAMFAFINTNTAAAAGIIGWILIEWMLNKKPTMLGAVSGAIAGLVAITPAAGFVTPFSSIVIGFIGGLVCFWGVYWLKRLSDTMMRLTLSACMESAGHGAASRPVYSPPLPSMTAGQTDCLRRSGTALEADCGHCGNLCICIYCHFRYH